MTKKKKSYSKQFKIDAIQLMAEQGCKVSEAARNLDVHSNILRHWRRPITAPMLTLCMQLGIS